MTLCMSLKLLCPLRVRVESQLFERLLNAHYECVVKVCDHACASSVCPHTEVCVCECACMFFSEHYHSAANLLLPSASTQMSGHRTFSEGSSGICKDKHWEQSTENNNVL